MNPFVADGELGIDSSPAASLQASSREQLRELRGAVDAADGGSLPRDGRTRSKERCRNQGRLRPAETLLRATGAVGMLRPIEPGGEFWSGSIISSPCRNIDRA
jgi:hypothetical protein